MTTATNGAAAPADDFIPAPGGETPSAADNSATTAPVTDIDIAPITVEEGVGQTELILALVGVLLVGLFLSFRMTSRAKRSA